MCKICSDQRSKLEKGADQPETGQSRATRKNERYLPGVTLKGAENNNMCNLLTAAMSADEQLRP
jgi:hypothetical protein